MLKTIVAICIGASVGALARWFLGIKLNTLFTSIPPGTLAANLIGGYIVGVAVAFFANAPEIAPEWRLFVITGFCGGLTTFSSFSAEVIALLEDGDLGRAFTSVVIHVTGSLLMTAMGIASWQSFASR